MRLRHFLEAAGACPEALAWVGDMSFNDAWRECREADWLMWLAVRSGAVSAREAARILLEVAPVETKGFEVCLDKTLAWIAGAPDETVADVCELSFKKTRQAGWAREASDAFAFFEFVGDGARWPMSAVSADSSSYAVLCASSHSRERNSAPGSVTTPDWMRRRLAAVPGFAEALAAAVEPHRRETWLE